MDGEYAERIVCLTDETTETLYLLEQDWRIVGISGFSVRPACARAEKPVVSAFTKARISEIVDLQPDLVLGFSDIQAEIAAMLVAAGVETHVFNQRTVAGILRMIRTLGGMIGCPERARDLANTLAANVLRVQTDSRHKPRPKVYFEEWNEPMITGIGWVSELITAAGGIDIFADLSTQSLAKNRILADPGEVVRRNPDIILGSWCGKPFRPEEVKARDGWDKISAVRSGDLHEIESSIILQPGPAALTEGVQEIQRILDEWRAKNA